jgi:phage gpG-like protein
MATQLRLKEKASAIEATNRKMLQIAATDAKNHFVKSFANEGFTDETLQTWKPRKGKIRSLGAYSLGRKTLTKTGKLRRSISFRVGSKSATVFSNLPYSAIHNEGLTGLAWGKHSFKMPKRKFLGNSKILERRTQAKWLAQLKTAIRNA